MENVRYKVNTVTSKRETKTRTNRYRHSSLLATNSYHCRLMYRSTTRLYYCSRSDTVRPAKFTHLHKSNSNTKAIREAKLMDTSIMSSFGTLRWRYGINK